MSLVSIVGPGAMGLTLADALVRAGVRVQVVDKKARAAELKQRGLWVKRRGVSVQPIRADVSDTVHPEASLVVLALQAPALAKFLESSSASVPAAADVAVLTASLKADEAVCSRFPQAKKSVLVPHVFASCIRLGEVDVHLRTTERPSFTFAALEHNADTPNAGNEARKRQELEALRSWQELSAGVGLHAAKRREALRWTQLMANLSFAAGAATDLDRQRLYGHKNGALLVARAQKEAALLAKAAKLPFETMHEFGFWDLAVRRWRSVRAIEKNETAHRVRHRDVEFAILGPILQSLRRSVPTEEQESCGEVVRLGRSLNVPTPVCSALLDTIGARARGELRTTSAAETTALIQRLLSS